MKKTALLLLFISLMGLALSCGSVLESGEPLESPYDNLVSGVMQNFTGVDSSQEPPVSSALVSENDQLKAKLGEKIEGSILQFYLDDYDGDGSAEAFAFVGTPENSEDPQAAQIWFVSKNAIEMLYDSYFYGEPELWQMDGKRMLFVEEGFGIGIGAAHLWAVKNHKPVRIENTGEELTHDKGNDFFTIISDFDFTSIENVHLSDYATNDIGAQTAGHTWKRYYLYWDGAQMREYGGIEISIDQFLEFGGVEYIIDDIKAKGCTITDIFYRENGIININYYHYDQDATCYVYDNVTLSYHNDGMYIVQAYDNNGDMLSNSSYGGIYKAAAFPDIATFPKQIILTKEFHIK